jgi:hypothetical protein
MDITSTNSSAPGPVLSRMSDKEDNLDVDVLGLFILAGILDRVNGPIIVGTIAHNVMQENSQGVHPKGSYRQTWTLGLSKLIALDLAPIKSKNLRFEDHIDLFRHRFPLLESGKIFSLLKTL